ncbi:MAG: NUDIX hydrolase [Burkholderiaceae bacterium]
MNFCSECAHPVTLLIPPDDNRLRHVCTQCGTIHYQNPKIVVGSIPVWERDGQPQLLLCRRAIEPRHGYWTLPAGYMENGETTAEAAMRETLEEAGARIELHEPLSLVDVPHVNQVHIFSRATLLDLDYEAGVESLEVNLFGERDIPWDEIAFPTISQTLRFFFEDRARGASDAPQYRLHTHRIVKPMR